MAAYPKFIWMNGKLVETEKATVPFFNTTLHYGAGVFEGIRCYSHSQRSGCLSSERTYGPADQFGPHPGCSRIPLHIRRTMPGDQRHHQGQWLFILLHPSAALPSPAQFPSLNLDDGKAAVGIAVWEMGAYLGEEQIENGMRANVASFTRHHPNVSMTKAKVTGNYANSILAKTESIRLGFEEAIMLDPQGYVAECTGENLFLVRKGALYSPITADTLEGITRDSLITIIKELGYTVTETMIGRDQLYICRRGLHVRHGRRIDPGFRN